MNVIARLEFELTYYDSGVHRFNHYTTRATPWGLVICWLYASRKRFGLVWFYGILTIIGHWMPNPFYSYILIIWFLHFIDDFLKQAWASFFLHIVKWFHLISNNSFFLHTVEYKTTLFQTIHFSISTVFVYTKLNAQTVLFQTIQSSMSTELKGCKYCYVSLTIQ